MASTRQMQQFFYSFTRMLSGLQGSISMVQQAKAALTKGGVTVTAVAYGSAGNSITLAYTAGGTAGAEVVTVTGNDISVQIESGVSTITQVRTAINASVAAAALVLATGTSGTAVSAAAASSLAGGIDGVSSYSILGVSNVVQNAVGQVTITLSDVWPAMMSPRFQIAAATAQDLIPQVKSIDLPNKTIVFNLLTGGTKTDPTSAITVYMAAKFRNSTVAQ